VRLVDDHEIPVGALETGPHLVALGEVDRGDGAVGAPPRLVAEVPLDAVGAQDVEFLVELVGELLAPLERERRGADDQHPVGHAAQAELLVEQAGHDGLAGARVVGEHESQPRLRQHVPVDGDDLVREAAHARHRDGEVRVVGEGEFDAVGLHEVEEVVAGDEGRLLVYELDGAVLEVGASELGLVEAAGGGAHAELEEVVAEWVGGLEAHDAGKMTRDADPLAD